ncbi:MAG: M4 family metallopeptidase, partial [Longispora sp.]|nr:M4 family metallopeptidase [Longispora sp. (in: high G+C Gram-positive bacteria)]
AGIVSETSPPRLVIDASSGVGRLAWETVITGMNGQTPSKLHVLTDANTGAVTNSFDEIKTLAAVSDIPTGPAGSATVAPDTEAEPAPDTEAEPSVAGTGTSIYSGTVGIDTTQTATGFVMTDQAHGNGKTCDMNQGSSTCSDFTNATNVWGNGTPANRQSAGVDAHFGAALTFDYFKNVHGRNGIFGNGTGVPSRAHYGNNYVNAFWNGSSMTYGDGDGNQKPLVAIDVAGHEMSHGVTEAVVSGGLTYSGESGGLNEATSDIFGTFVEFSANNNSDKGDYDIGEKIDIFGTGKPLRYMVDPTLDGKSHGCWSTSTKDINVHYSSGPGNHFIFNLAEGTGATAYGTSPVCNNAPAVKGIGRDKAAKIWFKALDAYFTSNTSYVNTTNPGNTSRAYTLSAAKELYGACSAEYKTVQAAWAAVNVAGSDAACGGSTQDFTVSVSPDSASVEAGGSATATISTTTTAGEAQALSLTAAGLPSGATVSFNPAQITSGGSSTVTVTTTNAVAPGTYVIRLTATGSTTRSANYTLVVKAPAMCSPTGQKLVNPGFESGTSGWTASSGVIGAWGSNGSPRTGAYSAWLNGYGNTNTNTISQTVTLPNGCATYTLAFHMKISTSEASRTTAYDKLTVKAGDTTLATYSNLNAASGYSIHTFNLSAFAGKTVTISFTGIEDSSLQTSFTIDDTAVTVA